MSQTPAPGGVVGAAVVVLTLVGTLLWLEIAAGPWRLGAGLLGSGAHLARGERRLAAGSLKKARFEILSAGAASARARSGLGAPLLDVAGLVPAARGALGELPHLVAAAQHSTAAARGTLEIAQGALRGRDKVIVRDEDGGGRVRIGRIEALATGVTQVREQLGAARRELRAVALERLPRRARPPVRAGIARATAGDRALADAESGLRLLPGILGADGRRWYLIGMQNNAELRGPGGALLRFGLLEMRDGEPSLASSSVYDIDVEREPIDIPLPEDAWYVRGITDAQRFGNANWSPHWPLSARLTVAYGRASRPSGRRRLPPVSGVVGVDAPAMASLMPGVGRYRTRGGRPLTKDNVVPFLLYKAYGAHPRRGVRRAVLIDVVERFYAGFLAPAHPTELVQGLGHALAHKHMQIWLARGAEQRYVERMGWDGAIQETDGGDYLYVVQQNVGGNKLNYVERQEHRVDVRVRGDDALVSTTVDVFNGVVLPQPGYWLGDSEGLHRPMLNVYVPRRARLLDARVRGRLLPTPFPAVWTGGEPPEHREKGKKVWSATLEIPPQRSGRVSFDYRVPGAVRTVGRRRIYRLVVQHQPKVRPEDLRVTMTLPEGAEAVQAKGWRRRGRRLVWRRALQEDRVLEVSWRP